MEFVDIFVLELDLSYEYYQYMVYICRLKILYIIDQQLVSGVLCSIIVKLWVGVDFKWGFF